MSDFITDAPLADVLCNHCMEKYGPHRYVVHIETIEGKRTPIGVLTCSDGHEQVMTVVSRPKAT